MRPIPAAPKEPPRRRWRVQITALALGLAVLLGWLLSRSSPPAPTQASGTRAASPELKSESSSAAVNSDSAGTRPPANPGEATPAGDGAPDARRATTVSADLQQTIAENLVPGRMVFLDFILDARGLRLIGATGAAGRAKPAGTRSGIGFVHYEVFDAGGALLLAGSVEDPTRRRVEYPAASNDGRIESTVQLSEEGPLALRLPGEVPARRIVLFRDRNPLAPQAGGREILGEFILRSPP